MDPPKELTVSDVTEDAVTLSWIKPLAPFEYYKLSYQSAKGTMYSTPFCVWFFHSVSVVLPTFWIYPQFYTLSHQLITVKHIISKNF